MWQFSRERLIALRKGLGLTQTEFAEKLGLNTKQRISQLETEEDYVPSTKTILHVANTFGVTPGLFFVQTEKNK
ncbi:MAG: helix-turn-helix domain-containing protein [Nanoarchaeota archaeon]|nr:helix-turn-helix domain-containing protein [Nanoarchaeota archaeon]